MDWSPFKRGLWLLFLMVFLVALLAVGRYAFGLLRVLWSVPSIPVWIPLAVLVLMVVSIADSVFARVLARMTGLIAEVTGSDEHSDA